jgi:hypothetical protein
MSWLSFSRGTVNGRKRIPKELAKSRLIPERDFFWFDAVENEQRTTFLVQELFHYQGKHVRIHTSL